MRNGSYRRNAAEIMAVEEFTLAMLAPAPLVQLEPPSSGGRRAQESRGTAAVSALPDRAINLCQVDARDSSRNRELASTLCADVSPCSYVGKTLNDGSCYPLLFFSPFCFPPFLLARSFFFHFNYFCMYIVLSLSLLSNLFYYFSSGVV
jgi:hypothetical protein